MSRKYLDNTGLTYFWNKVNNKKQNTLVSGTNIKTINNQSLLGSGNITVQSGGGTWGSITGTLSDQTDLQDELDNKVDAYNEDTEEGVSTEITTRPDYIMFDVSNNTELTKTVSRIDNGAIQMYLQDNELNWTSSITMDDNGTFISNNAGTTITDVVTPTTNDMAANKGYVDTGLSAKQATLVSGTNIKTINNESLLGSGNISISGGGGSSAKVIDASDSSEWDAQDEEPTQTVLQDIGTHEYQVLVVDNLSGGSGIYLGHVYYLSLKLDAGDVHLRQYVRFEEGDEEENEPTALETWTIGNIDEEAPTTYMFFAGSNEIMKDFKINGASIASNGTANIVTNTAYNATSNKIATMSDIPSVPVTDVRVNDGSIISNGVANLVTNAAYNASTNKLATMSDVPSVSDRLKIYNRSGYNLNTCYDAGVYLVAQGSNIPSGSNYGSLLVMPYRKADGNTTPDFGTQIFMPNGDDNTHPNSFYYRTALSGSWNNWQELETTTNKVTSISSSSTDAQYPSAKCVYDIVGDIESLLGGI